MSLRKKRVDLEDLLSLSERQVLILRESNIDSILSLATTSVSEIRSLLDTTPAKAASVVKEARDSLPPIYVKDAKEILQVQNTKNYLPLGCKALDKLLGGKGIESGSITEFYAQFASGKSQICFTAMVRAILGSETKSEEVNGSAIFLDTEGTFSPHRILQIRKQTLLKDNVEDTPQKEQQFLKNLFVISPFSSTEQMQALKELNEDEGLGYLKYLKNAKPLKLLVVDSLTHLFRCEYIGRGTLAERQQKLNEHVRDLYLFAIKNKLPVIITNQVISNPDPFSPKGDLACGGNITGHGTGTRILLVKRGVNRIAKLIDSPKLPSSEAVYTIGKRGVMDLKEDEGELE
jgi:DNA repair protein RadA